MDKKKYCLPGNKYDWAAQNRKTLNKGKPRLP